VPTRSLLTSLPPHFSPARRLASKEAEDARAALETAAKEKPAPAAVKPTTSKIPTVKPVATTTKAPPPSNTDEVVKLKASVKQLNKEKTRVCFGGGQVEWLASQQHHARRRTITLTRPSIA
jgi:hypothetical protein